MTDLDYEKLADLISTKIIFKLKKEQDHQRSFDWSRKNLFGNHSKAWIKYWIIGKHPEILTDNGGWLTPPAGTGHPIKIVSEKQARQWLETNKSRIDWNAPEPITLKRKAGLAKPIKRSNNK